MTDFELLKDITQKVEGENLREMMIACVGYGNYMDVLPKILARKDLFQLGEQLQRKYLVSTLEDGTTTVNGIVLLLLAAFVLALPQTFAKNCSPVLPHSGLKFGTVRDAKL